MDWFVWLQVGKGDGKEMKGEEEPKDRTSSWGIEGGGGGVPNKTWRSLYGLYTPQQQHFPVQAKHPYKNTKLHSFSNNI